MTEFVYFKTKREILSYKEIYYTKLKIQVINIFNSWIDY